MDIYDLIKEDDQLSYLNELSKSFNKLNPKDKQKISDTLPNIVSDIQTLEYLKMNPEEVDALIENNIDIMQFIKDNRNNNNLEY